MMYNQWGLETNYNWDSCRVCKRLVRSEVKDYLMIKKMTPGVVAWNEPLGGMPIPADSPAAGPAW